MNKDLEKDIKRFKLSKQKYVSIEISDYGNLAQIVESAKLKGITDLSELVLASTRDCDHYDAFECYVNKTEEEQEVNALKLHIERKKKLEEQQKAAQVLREKSLLRKLAKKYPNVLNKK